MSRGQRIRVYGRSSAALTLLVTLISCGGGSGSGQSGGGPENSVSANIRLEVANGTGPSLVAAGSVVSISAGSPETNYYFSHWSSQNGGLLQIGTTQRLLSQYRTQTPSTSGLTFCRGFPLRPMHQLRVGGTKSCCRRLEMILLGPSYTRETSSIFLRLCTMLGLLTRNWNSPGFWEILVKSIVILQVSARLLR